MSQEHLSIWSSCGQSLANEEFQKPNGHGFFQTCNKCRVRLNSIELSYIYMNYIIDTTNQAQSTQ